MDHRPLHLHSMVVHAVIGLAPLAALSFLFEAGGTTIFSVGPEVWAFLLRGSLIGMFVLALPSILTGVVERNHMYVNWPPSHRAKLALSLMLVVMVSVELIALVGIDGAPVTASWLGFAIVIGNCAVVFGLSFFGLQISLGRQGFGRTSYKPDMDWDPPLNILACVADFAGDPPRLIDVQGEAER
jgi:hypothetical protein